MDRKKKLSLPPGFRFHPTDEELVNYYLKRKIFKRTIGFDSIGVVDLYKYEPWDLPDMSLLQTRDLEWYFFCPKDRKYLNGSRTNRATEQGYWKATGKDRSVLSGGLTVGVKKTLVYYRGRAPKGERTNWVIHEYRLNDAECENLPMVQNGFVLCRLYKKSGAGPKNGEQYGAPVEDEEWESKLDDMYGCTEGEYEAGINLDELTHSHSHIALAYGFDDVKGESGEIDQNPVNLSTNYLERCKMVTESQLNKAVVDHSCGDQMAFFTLGQFLDSPVSFLEDEGEILQQILQLATENEILNVDNFQSSCNMDPDQKSDNPSFKDGDFIELDDLCPALPYCINGIESTREPNQMAENPFFRDGYFLELNDLCPTFPYCGNGIDLTGMKQDPTARQSDVPARMHPTTNFELDSVFQCMNQSTVETSTALDDPELASVQEPDYPHGDASWHLNYHNASDSSAQEALNVEDLARSMSAELHPFEGMDYTSNNLFVQDGTYYDALASLPEILDSEEDLNKPFLDVVCGAFLEGTESDFPAGANSFLNDVLPASADNASDNADNSSGEEMNSYPQSMEGTLLGIRQAKIGLEGQHSSKAYDIICNCLGSVPSLPASAAELSPRIVSTLKSVNLMITDVDLGALDMSCNCVNDVLVSHCKSCMSLKSEKQGSFIQSLSMCRQRSTEISNMGLYMIAFLGVIWAFLWLLMLGGAWKVFGGVFRLLLSG